MWFPYLFHQPVPSEGSWSLPVGSQWAAAMVLLGPLLGGCSDQHGPRGLGVRAEGPGQQKALWQEGAVEQVGWRRGGGCTRDVAAEREVSSRVPGPWRTRGGGGPGVVERDGGQRGPEQQGAAGGAGWCRALWSGGGRRSPRPLACREGPGAAAEPPPGLAGRCRAGPGATAGDPPTVTAAAATLPWRPG